VATPCIAAGTEEQCYKIADEIEAHLIIYYTMLVVAFMKLAGRGSGNANNGVRCQWNGIAFMAERKCRYVEISKNAHSIENAKMPMPMEWTLLELCGSPFLQPDFNKNERKRAIAMLSYMPNCVSLHTEKVHSYITVASKEQRRGVCL